MRRMPTTVCTCSSYLSSYLLAPRAFGWLAPKVSRLQPRPTSLPVAKRDLDPVDRSIRATIRSRIARSFHAPS